jgi:hypothetical protein
VFGFAAVPAPVPAVVDGTHVTGVMPVGFALPCVPAAGGVAGAGTVPAGV